MTRNTGVGERIVERLKAIPADTNGWIRLEDTGSIVKEVGADQRDFSRVIGNLAERGLLEVRMKNRRRYDAIRFLAASPSGTMSAKDVVLGVLRSYANKRGWVRTDLHKVARLTGLSEHDLLKLMFDLKQMNRITFRKVGNGSSMRLASIRVLSGRGRTPMRSSELAMTLTQAEREGVVPAVEEPVDTVETPVAAPERAVVAPTAPASPKYPLIRQLVQRRFNVEEAIKHLEAAGLDDEALALMDKADRLTPLEREVADLVQELGWPK